MTNRTHDSDNKKRGLGSADQATRERVASAGGRASHGGIGRFSESSQSGSYSSTSHRGKNEREEDQ